MSTKRFKLKKLTTSEPDSARIVELDISDHQSLLEKLFQLCRLISSAHTFTLCYMSRDGRAVTVLGKSDIPIMLLEFDDRTRVDLFVNDSKTLNCMLCKRGFMCEGERVPLILYCNHTVCNECFNHLLAHRQQLQAKVAAPPSPEVQCPLCQTVTNLEKRSVESFQNEPLKNVLARIQGQQGASSSPAHPVKLCEECGEQTQSPATLFCQNCPASLCESCSNRLHQISRVMQNHVRLELSAAESTLCQDHPKRETEVFCLTCNKPVCFECTFEGGKCSGHKSATMAQVAQIREDELERQAMNLAKLREELADHLSRVEDHSARTTKTASEATIHVKDTTAVLHTALEKKKEALVGEVKKIEESKKAVLDLQKAHLQLGQDCVKTVQDACLSLKRPVPKPGTSQNVCDVQFVKQSTAYIDDAKGVSQQVSSINRVNILQHVQGRHADIFVTTKQMEYQKQQLLQKIELQMGSVVTSPLELADEESRFEKLREPAQQTVPAAVNILNHILLPLPEVNANNNVNNWLVTITPDSNPLHVLAFFASVVSVGMSPDASPTCFDQLPGLVFALSAACLTYDATYCGYDIRALCIALQPHLKDQQRLKNFLRDTEVATDVDVNLQWFKHYSESLPYAIFNFIEGSIALIQRISPRFGYPDTLGLQLLSCKNEGLVPQKPGEENSSPRNMPEPPVYEQQPPVYEQQPPPVFEQQPPVYEQQDQDHVDYQHDQPNDQHDQAVVQEDQASPYQLPEIPGHTLRYFYDDDGKMLLDERGIPYYEYVPDDGVVEEQ